MNRFYAFLVIFITLMNLGGCDDMIKMTKPLIEGDDFETPFNMLSYDLSTTFVRGEENFTTVFHNGRRTGANFQ